MELFSIRKNHYSKVKEIKPSQTETNQPHTVKDGSIFVNM
jgi:hypothetical protein